MAGQIPRHFIDDLLNRIDIVDVIGLRVKLKKTGSNHSACCPFHSEKTPSFTVSQTKQFYHCFGCGVNGNAIGFLMEYENMHFVDAVEMLAESAGVEVPRESGGSDPQVHQERKSLYQLMDECTAFYCERLKHHQPAIDYLKNRGLDGETALQFRIGYAPEGWDTLTGKFPGQDSDLLKCGMLIKHEKKGSVYDRFRDRIMFPIRDRRGRVIGFGGRVMSNQEPKYLNSPETTLFHKGSELYGLYECRKEAQSQQQVIVVEGYMDVVALARHGITNAVATLGTATNQAHAESLFKVVPEIVFCFDGDRAGRDAAWRALNATIPCLADGRDAHFLFLPDGEDPDSIVSQGGKEAFDAKLEQRKPLIDFLFEHLAGDADLTLIGTRARLAEDAKPLLEKIPAGVYQQLAQQRLETLIGVSLGQKPSRPAARTRQKPAAQSRSLNPMRRAILLLLQNPSLVAGLTTEERTIDSSLPGALLLDRIWQLCEENPETTTGLLIENFRDSSDWTAVSKLAATPYFPDGRELDPDKIPEEFKHCVASLKQQSTPREATKLHPDSKTGLLSLVRQNLKKGPEDN